jgi:hypothetical protein
MLKSTPKPVSNCRQRDGLATSRADFCARNNRRYSLSRLSEPSSGTDGISGQDSLPRRIYQVCTTALMAGAIKASVRKAVADLEYE